MFTQFSVYLVLKFGLTIYKIMFIPNKFKFKKQHRGTYFNKIKSNINLNQLKFGNIGLKSLSFSRISSKQLLTLRQLIRKILKKKGKLKINAFSSTPVTKKSVGVRMGKGKGNVDHWIFKMKPGFILCEITTKNLPLAIKAFKSVKARLPIFTKIIKL